MPGRRSGQNLPEMTELPRSRPLFRPTDVYFERRVRAYPLGAALLERYDQACRPAGPDRPRVHYIETHNLVPELRGLPDEAFTRKKRVLVVGVRKSLRLVPNRLSADYIVPFTSSGCPAMCLYCYLTCTFFSNSYLRLFVNREEMWRVVERRVLRAHAEGERGHEGGEPFFELGSNSDMLVDESLTGNLSWAVERFARLPYGRATLATKFACVEPLLGLDHRGRTRIRVSVNPPEIVRRVEIGTAPLAKRLEAARLLHEAGYEVGVNLAPVILVEGWRHLYRELLVELADTFPASLKDGLYVEVIFMTYGLYTRELNRRAFPGLAVLDDLDRPEIMRPKGRGKLCYVQPERARAEAWLREELARTLPGARLSYIC